MATVLQKRCEVFNYDMQGILELLAAHSAKKKMPFPRYERMRTRTRARRPKGISLTIGARRIFPKQGDMQDMVWGEPERARAQNGKGWRSFTL